MEHFIAIQTFDTFDLPYQHVSNHLDFDLRFKSFFCLNINQAHLYSCIYCIAHQITYLYYILMTHKWDISGYNIVQIHCMNIDESKYGVWGSCHTQTVTTESKHVSIKYMHNN